MIRFTITLMMMILLPMTDGSPRVILVTIHFKLRKCEDILMFYQTTAMKPSI